MYGILQFLLYPHFFLHLHFFLYLQFFVRNDISFLEDHKLLSILDGMKLYDISFESFLIGLLTDHMIRIDIVPKQIICTIVHSILQDSCSKLAKIHVVSFSQKLADSAIIDEGELYAANKTGRVSVQRDWLAKAIGELLQERVRDDGGLVTSEREEGHTSADTACKGWLFNVSVGSCPRARGSLCLTYSVLLDEETEEGFLERCNGSVLPLFVRFTSK